jgi:hypothetical protein
MGINTGMALKLNTFEITQEILGLIAEVEEFNGMLQLRVVDGVPHD